MDLYINIDTKLNFMDGGKVVISWFISQLHKLSRTNVYQSLSHVSLGFMYFNVFHTNKKVSTLIKYATLTCLSKIIFIDKRVQKYFKLIILLEKNQSYSIKQTGVTVQCTCK